MEGGSGGEIELPFSPLFCVFHLYLVQNSVCHFLNPNQTTAVTDAWVSAGMLVLGFLKLKIRGGCLPNC